jgi:hypothetical protein
MEEIKRFYSQRAITIATYFGGPLAAGYLVKKNYEALDQANNANKSMILGVISSILLFAGIISIPEEIIDKIPNALIPGIYTIIIYFIVEKLQGSYLKQHKESGGQFQSAWRAVGAGAICMLIIGAFIFLAAYLSGDLPIGKNKFDAVTYDKGVAKFVENETKALSVFNVIETEEPDYLINEFNKGIILWKNNKEIISKLNLIENLPNEFIEQNRVLLKYCDLRIDYNMLIIKAIAENTDKYASELDKKDKIINDILKQLK